MSFSVTLKGVTYTLAEDGDRDYGDYMTTLINALVNAADNSPLQTNSIQFDAVVSDDANRRTHATLEAVIADGAVTAGSNVLVDGVTFAQAATLNISKKLYIYGIGNSTFQAAAGLGASPIIRFSASGSRFQGFTLDANALTPTYAVQVDAAVMNIVLDIEIMGAYATGDLDNQSTNEAIIGFVKRDTGNYLLPISAPGVNTALSNLSSPTAINEDLVYDTDNTYDFCSDALEAKDVWTHNIKHNDVATPDLNITVTGNNGDINLVPHGTGKVNIGGGSVDTSVEVQDFTTINAVGTASQQQAGHIWTYTDLDAELPVWNTLAYYRFANGALTTDDVGAFNLTEAGNPANTNGIMGTAYAVDLDGTGDYYHVNGLLDTPSTIVNGIVISFWFKADDGHPAATQYIFEKVNIPGTDLMNFVVNTDGTMEFTMTIGGTAMSLKANSVLPNGATDWHYVAISLGVFGYLLIINGVVECSKPITLGFMGDDVGAGTDFFIGDTTATGNEFAGLITQFIVADANLSQYDVDFLTSTLYAEPVAIQGTEYFLVEKKQAIGFALFESQDLAPVVAKYNNNIYRKGFVYDPDDKIKLIAKVGG